jgi:hypothetical protein
MFNKLNTAAVLLGSSSLLVSAFPHIAEMVAEQKRQVGLPAIPFPEWPGLPTHALYNKFDAAAQYVSVSGEHEYRAPGPGDIRGPCAGLNAAANQYVLRSFTQCMQH